MTRKEAIKRLKNIWIRDALQEDYDALYMAINSLEIDERYELEYEQAEPKTDALDKIRAEIEHEYTYFRNKSDMWNERACGIGMALDIINKYAAESEDKE